MTFQAAFGDLIEQGANDGVGRHPGPQRAQADGVPAALVQQGRGGVGEGPLRPLLLRPAHDVRGPLAVVRLVVGVDGQQPGPPAVPAGEPGHVVQRLHQPGDEAVRARQVAADGPAGGLVAEREEPAGDGEQRGRGGGHDQEQVEELGHRDDPADRLPVEACGQGLPGVLVNDPGGEARMSVTHRQSPIQASA
jgi:hypothetical protein